MKEITIRPVLNGFLVKVGCSEVAFTSVADLCSELRRYCLNPNKLEDEYLKNAINKPGPGPEPAADYFPGGVASGISLLNTARTATEVASTDRMR